MAAVEMLTREDLDAMPDDGNRYELIEGEIVMSPSPRPRHQLVSTELLVRLYAACPDHLRVSQAPFDVVLGEHEILVPDILVVDPSKLDERGMNGPPALVVEVLSPSMRRRDLGQKKRIYERSGVAAYWVVDVEGDEIALTAWELRDGRYEAVAAIAGDEEWTATVPFEITVVPSQLVR
ncbi:Uma2 family endonuclease [Nocardioides sp. LHD-245]|uniref:Uma2 family endonuclease n=1 Tax=Nocardioides sp. LHD-245 TaxID=3051387 RepID=UPI0027E12083|nr:Uma2 family endonuclease [Nocardioides sp. LHD-245]